MGTNVTVANQQVQVSRARPAHTLVFDAVDDAEDADIGAGLVAEEPDDFGVRRLALLRNVAAGACHGSVSENRYGKATSNGNRRKQTREFFTSNGKRANHTRAGGLVTMMSLASLDFGKRNDGRYGRFLASINTV
jgi:hypothetical protein